MSKRAASNTLEFSEAKKKRTSFSPKNSLKKRKHEHPLFSVMKIETVGSVCNTQTDSLDRLLQIPNEIPAMYALPVEAPEDKNETTNEEVDAKTSPKNEPKKRKQEHPPFSAMIIAAIGTLKEKKGSSKQAIERYILSQSSKKRFHFQQTKIRNFTQFSKKTFCMIL